MMFGFLPRLESRALKYGYSNVRARSMKGRLINEGMLNEMIRVPTVDAMIELMQRTDYKTDLASASTRYSGSRIVEYASSQSFSRAAGRLLKVAPSSDRPALRALLMKWDLNNLKTLMNAKRIGMGYEDARPGLFIVGGLDEDDFKAIMKAEDRVLLRSIKRTSLGKEIFRATADPEEKRMQDSLENAFRSLDAFHSQENTLDAYAYMIMDRALASVRGKETGSIRDSIRKEIDAKNILIIERMKKHGSDPKRIPSALIKGGTLKDPMIRRIIESRDLAGVASVLKNRFPRMKLKDSPGLRDLEMAFEREIARSRARAFHRNILSLGVIISFLLLKEEEANNLRKIAKGKEFKLSESEVKETLVVI